MNAHYRDNAWQKKSSSKLRDHYQGHHGDIYIGLTASEFKTRWRNHKTSFTHEKRKNDTELSKSLWQLKDKQEEYSIAWRIVAKAKPYTNHTKRCNLCTAETHLIITKPFMATLNKRKELISTCRHERKFILKYN